MAEVKIVFLGVDLVGGGEKEITMEVDGEVSLEKLFRPMAQRLGVEGLEERIGERFLVLVDGTSIDYLRKSETIIKPGSIISVVPMVGGG